MTDPLKQSQRWCHQLARRTAGNFYFSFLTLPRQQRIDMCVLYAFMRLTDDLGDEETLSIQERTAALERWKQQITRLLAGVDDTAQEHPAFPAIAHLVRNYEISEHLLLAVIDGVMMDLSHTKFQTFGELENYCYHVAGAVGLCCLQIWGYTSSSAQNFAIDCGLAFQLTNILRDLVEDAQRNRLYLPAEELERFQVPTDQFLKGALTPDVTRLLEFQYQRAWQYYWRAQQLHELLAPPGRTIYAAMFNIYFELLQEIRQRKFDVFSGRICLSPTKKIAIAGRCILRHKWLKQSLRTIRNPTP